MSNRPIGRSIAWALGLLASGLPFYLYFKRRQRGVVQHVDLGAHNLQQDGGGGLRPPLNGAKTNVGPGNGLEIGADAFLDFPHRVPGLAGPRPERGEIVFAQQVLSRGIHLARIERMILARVAGDFFQLSLTPGPEDDDER